MPYATTDDGVRLYVEETGAGAPVVFVHEFAADHRSWEAQMRHFGQRYRAVTYGARGYPPSDVPPDPASYSQQLGAAAKNMEALNALYAVQLDNSTSQLEIQNTVMEKLSASAQNTDALAGEVAKLSQNLSQLNSVYGNMLAAMNVRS